MAALLCDLARQQMAKFRRVRHRQQGRPLQHRELVGRCLVAQVERRMIPTRRHGVCPRCIAADKVPFVRKEWTLGWAAVCEQHSLVLNTGCSDCRSLFILPPLRSPGYGWLMGEGCRCGAALADEPAILAHPLAIRLQAALRTGRAADYFSWPGLGTMEWAMAVALIDLILGIA